VTKPNPENCKNCSSKCAYNCAQLSYTIQHRTVLIISPLTSRQTPLRYCLSEERGLSQLKQEALLWQRDRATRLSVEILQLQNIPIVWHYLRDPTFSRFYTNTNYKKMQYTQLSTDSKQAQNTQQIQRIHRHSETENDDTVSKAQSHTATYMNHAHAAVDWKCLSNLLIITCKWTATFFIAQFCNSNNFTWLITGTKVLS